MNLLKNAKVQREMLMVNFTSEVSLLNDNLKLTCEHQVFVSQCKNGDISGDFDFIDWYDIEYCGEVVKDFGEFMNFHLKMGIDLRKIINKKWMKW